jgi:predicted nucleotidyltransferase
MPNGSIYGQNIVYENFNQNNVATIGESTVIQEIDRQAVLEFESRLNKFVSVLDMRVFGSRARGDATEESDLDLFIKVTELSQSIREQIYDLAWEIGFKYDRVISTFVVTEAQIKNDAVGASPLLLKVLEEGIAV